MLSRDLSLLHGGGLPVLLRKPVLGLPNITLITRCAQKVQVVPFIEESLTTRRSEPEDFEEAQHRIRDIPVEACRWLLRILSGDEQKNIVMLPMPF